MTDERDKDGKLTPWALAMRTLESRACDCRPLASRGTCMRCLCEDALREQHDLVHQYSAALAAVKESLKATQYIIEVLT